MFKEHNRKDKVPKFTANFWPTTSSPVTMQVKKVWRKICDFEFHLTYITERSKLCWSNLSEINTEFILRRVVEHSGRWRLFNEVLAASERKRIRFTPRLKFQQMEFHSNVIWNLSQCHPLIICHLKKVGDGALSWEVWRLIWPLSECPSPLS